MKVSSFLSSFLPSFLPSSLLPSFLPSLPPSLLPSFLPQGEMGEASMTHRCSEWLLFLASHGITYSCVHLPLPPALLMPQLRDTQPGWEVESACVGPTKPRTGAVRLPGPPPPSTPTWMLPGRRPCWPPSWQRNGQCHHQLHPVPPSPSCRAVNLQNDWVRSRLWYWRAEPTG